MHRIAFGDGRNRKPAISRQDAGINRLDGMGVDGMGWAACQEFGGGIGTPPEPRPNS